MTIPYYGDRRANSKASMGAAVKLMHDHPSDAYSFSDLEKSAAFRLPLAKKMSTPSTTLACQIDGQ
ncbi:MAG: hypothetical protein WBF43_01840 [Methylocella sp.]